jgi:hypothetical protein
MLPIGSLADAAAELAATFRGQLLKPMDAGYEDARKVHNGLVDKRPALIARCQGVADVVGAVDLTRSASRLQFAAAATMWRDGRRLMVG